MRELEPLEVLDVFVVGRVTGPVRISRDHPLRGELTVDVARAWFLSPEEDERGEGMGAVRVLGLPERTGFEFAGKIVQVAGIYEPGRGLTVEAIALPDEPLGPPAPPAPGRG